MEDNKLEKIRKKYVCVLHRPFECDYQSKEGFNLSPGLKNHTVCGFLSSPHTVLLILNSVHQNVQTALSHNCECTQVCSKQSSEAEICKMSDI